MGSGDELRILYFYLVCHLTHILSVNAGATARLSDSLITPNTSYNGADAMTVYAVEARSENAL